MAVPRLLVSQASTDLPAVPEAVAIIMDGNGRWAERRGEPRIFGHEAGAESVRKITRECARLGVKELTLYAFSSENWKRSEEEVDLLFGLLRRFLVDERPEIMGNAIRFRAIGRLAELPEPVFREYERTVSMSAGNDGMVLRLALSYGGRQELLDAARRLLDLARRDPDRARAAVADEEAFRSLLYEPGMADPDLLIRTAGEQRLSNFLLWQVSYAELYVTDVTWPDFRESHLHEAFRDYARRERRFGGRAPLIPAPGG